MPPPVHAVEASTTASQAPSRWRRRLYLLRRWSYCFRRHALRSARRGLAALLGAGALLVALRFDLVGRAATGLAALGGDTDTPATLAEATGVLLAGAGLAFVAWQVRQGLAGLLGSHFDATSTAISHLTDVEREHPAASRLLQAGSMGDLDALGPDEREEARLVAIAHLDFFDTEMLRDASFRGPATDLPGFEPWLAGLLLYSVLLRVDLVRHHEWYSDRMVARLVDLQLRAPGAGDWPAGSRLGDDQLADWLEREGQPWLSWVATRVRGDGRARPPRAPAVQDHSGPALTTTAWRAIRRHTTPDWDLAVEAAARG